jgi:hypothetical protein
MSSTRREFTQGSTVALFMAFLGPAKVEADAIEVVPSRSDLETLIDVRDTLRAMDVDPDSSYGLHVLKAAWEIDHAIMRRCPHDPAEYIHYPDEVIAGNIYPGDVECSHCRATTSLHNAKRSIDEKDGPLW